MDFIAKQIPYVLLWNKMPVDISFIFENEKPAGKHGFLQVKGENFVFEDGTPAKFWGTNFRPDIVIAEMDFDRHSDYFGDDVKTCIAVIELKYKNSTVPAKTILNDYDKLHKYVEKLKLDSKCRLYMATIWEREDEEAYWEDENSKWAKNRLTELNASYKLGTRDMRFYICKH